MPLCAHTGRSDGGEGKEDIAMSFLSIFLLCLVGVFLLVVISGFNGWLMVIGISLVLAAFLNGYIKLEERVDELEKRLPKEEVKEEAKEE